MLEKIRLATPEEIEGIAKDSDLTPMSRVVVSGDIKAVWRVTNELDPVFFGESSNQKRVLFFYGMENMLKGAGATEFYFNVPVTDEPYQKVLEHLGAQRTSKEPEYRYKVVL